MTRAISISIPADTPIRVDLDVSTFGRFFAELSDTEQADIFASMIEYLSPENMQWNYVADSIKRLSNAEEIQGVLKALSE